MILDKIGFFEEYDKAPPYYLLHKESNYDVQKVVSYLESGFQVRSWQEYRRCCFNCGAEGRELGCSELSDGKWVWTDDLIHYVRHHYIDLPVVFLSHVEAENFSINIPEALKCELALEKELCEKTLTGSGRIDYSNTKWNRWSELKYKTVDEATIKRLIENIKPFKVKEKNVPVGFKLPDSWS